MNTYKFPETEKCNIVKVTTYKTINKLGEPHKVERIVRTVFTWSKKARDKQKKYHETKNGKTYLKLPIKTKPKLSKEELLKLRQFSEAHYKLINEAYSGIGKSMQILKKIAENDKHRINIENIDAQLKAYKSSLKLRNLKNMLYKQIIYFKNDKQQIVPTHCEYVSKLPDVTYLSRLNSDLSTSERYHHLAIKDRKDNVIYLFVNSIY